MTAIGWEVEGPDTFIRDISRVEVREFINVLRFLPKNAVKLFPHLTLRGAAERAQSDGSVSRITAAHANTYLGNLEAGKWDHNVIETVLAHKDTNQIRGTYMRELILEPIVTGNDEDIEEAFELLQWYKIKIAERMIEQSNL